MLEFILVGNLDPVAVKSILLESSAETKHLNCLRVVPVQTLPASVDVGLGFLDCCDVERAVKFDFREALHRPNAIVTKAGVLQILVAPLIDGIPNEFTKSSDEPQDDGVVTALNIEYVPCISDFIVRWFFIWIFW